MTKYCCPIHVVEMIYISLSDGLFTERMKNSFNNSTKCLLSKQVISGHIKLNKGFCCFMILPAVYCNVLQQTSDACPAGMILQ